MLSIRLRYDQDAERSVVLRVENLHTTCGIPRVAGSVEDGARIRFLRLMIEDQNDFSADIYVGVIVVVELWGGDPKSGKDHVCCNVHIAGERAISVGEFPLLF